MLISDWSSDVCSSDLPDQRAAPFESLAGQHPSEFAGDPLVLAEHIADLAPADTNVARGDVDVGADVAIEFGHEALAKAHDLAHALALGVEVRPALAAAHRQAGRSEEHTSELQSLMRNSYAGFFLKNKI